MPSKNPNKPSHAYHEKTADRAEALVTKLVNDESIWPELLNIEVFSALFCKRNETFLEEMRWCFRHKLVALCATLNERQTSLLEKQRILNRHICTLPLAGIKTGQEYLIPAYDGNKWQLVNYKVMPIELSPTSGLGRLVLADNNRLFAYGFAPKKPTAPNFNPPPRLVFISPEYPAQQGFLANLYLWFQSVTGFYKSCESHINQWLKENFESGMPNATVHALGHASRLALEAAFTSSAEYIANFSISDAYNLPYSITNNYKTKWQAQHFKPKISVQLQEKHYNLLENLPDWAVYNSAGETLNEDIFKEYCKIRIASNILSGIINTLLIMPCQYLLIPVIRAILNHKTELALLSILVMVFLMLPGLVMTDIGTTLAVFTAIYFGFKLISPVKVILNAHEHSEASCHLTNHTEERAADDYIASIRAL